MARCWLSRNFCRASFQARRWSISCGRLRTNPRGCPCSCAAVALLVKLITMVIHHRRRGGMGPVRRDLLRSPHCGPAERHTSPSVHAGRGAASATLFNFRRNSGHLSGAGDGQRQTNGDAHHLGSSRRRLVLLLS